MQQDSDRQVREELITDCGCSEQLVCHCGQGTPAKRISRITKDKKTQTF